MAEHRRYDNRRQSQRDRGENHCKAQREEDTCLQMLAADRVALDEGAADTFGRDAHRELLHDDRHREAAEVGGRNQVREGHHRTHQEKLCRDAGERDPADAVGVRQVQLVRGARVAHLAAPSRRGPSSRWRSSRRT